MGTAAYGAKVVSDDGWKQDRLSERAADPARHGRMITHVGAARSCEPSEAVSPREIKGIPGSHCKLLQKPELRPPVAIPERMDMVDVARHRSLAIGKVVRPAAPEMPCHHHAAVDVGHAGFDEPSRLELASALTDPDGAGLSCPCADILEKVAVVRLQLGHVKFALRHWLRKALGDKLALHRSRGRRVPDASLLRRTEKSGGWQCSGRSFRRGGAAAMPDPAEDMGPSPLGRPSLAPEHFEHGDLLCGQRIALDRLQVRGLSNPTVYGDRQGGIRIMLLPGHRGTLSRPAGESDLHLATSILADTSLRLFNDSQRHDLGRYRGLPREPGNDFRCGRPSGLSLGAGRVSGRGIRDRKG